MMSLSLSPRLDGGPSCSPKSWTMVSLRALADAAAAGGTGLPNEGDGAEDRAATRGVWAVVLVGTGDAPVLVKPCLLNCLLCDPPPPVGTGEKRPAGVAAAVGVCKSEAPAGRGSALSEERGAAFAALEEEEEAAAMVSFSDTRGGVVCAAAAAVANEEEAATAAEAC